MTHIYIKPALSAHYDNLLHHHIMMNNIMLENWQSAGAVRPNTFTFSIDPW